MRYERAAVHDDLRRVRETVSVTEAELVESGRAAVASERMSAAKQGELMSALVDRAVCEHAHLYRDAERNRRVRLEPEGALIHHLVVLVAAEDHRAGASVDGGGGVAVAVQEEGLAVAHRRAVGGFVVDVQRRAVVDGHEIAGEQVAEIARLVDAALHAQADVDGLPRVRADQPSATFLFDHVTRCESVSLLGN